MSDTAKGRTAIEWGHWNEGYVDAQMGRSRSPTGELFYHYLDGYTAGLLAIKEKRHG